MQPSIFLFLTYRQKRKRKKRIQEIKQGFQSLLQSLMTSLQAGYALENACKVMAEEMRELYSSKHPIQVLISILNRGIGLQIPIWKLFYQMAIQSEVEEIYQFAVVLEISSQTGGNLVEIIRNTSYQLQMKMEAEEEIKVLISGKLLEKNIMLFMPFFILIYLRWMNPGYLDIFYHSLIGHLIMSALISGGVVCFYWTEKIINQCI